MQNDDFTFFCFGRATNTNNEFADSGISVNDITGELQAMTLLTGSPVMTSPGGLLVMMYISVGC